MTGAAAELIHLHGERKTPLAQRFADFLRAEHPRDTAKSVEGRLAAASEGSMPKSETIKAWLAARAFPTGDNLDRVIHAYGERVILGVFGHLILDAEHREELAVAQVEALAAEKRARLEATRKHRRRFLGLSV